MLIQLREGLRNSKILKFVFIGIITIPFALVGVGSYFSGSAQTTVASVNGDEIGGHQFDSALLRQQERMRQMFGGKIPDGLVNSNSLRQNAIEELVQRQLMVQRVQEQNYTVSDAELVRSIRERDDFKVDGEFSSERYQQILAANRTSTEVFEESARRDQGLVQLFNAVSGSAFVLPAESAAKSALKNQEREVLYVEADSKALADAAVIADADVDLFYSENEQQYMRPEQFKVSYIEINETTLGDVVEVDEAAVQAEYDSRIDEFATEEKRDASHILLSLEDGASDDEAAPVLAKAEELIAEINGGADFAALAKEHSDDPGSAANGGSLGEFGKGAMVQAFEEAAFSLEVGAISAPVRSPFGVHIIRLDGIVESVAKPYAEVAEQLKKELVTTQVSELFFENQDVLATESFENGGSLEPAATALGLEVQQSDWFSTEERVSVGVHQQVQEAVLSDDVLNAGLNSSVLEIADNHAIVIRLDEKKPTELKPLDEVREEIVARLKSTEGATQADLKIDQLIEAANGGADVAEVAASSGLTVSDAVWAKRDSADIDRTILSSAFATAYTEGAVSWGKATSGSGNPVALAVQAIRLAEAEEETQADDTAVQQMGRYAFQALQQGMRETADVDINAKAFDPAE